MTDGIMLQISDDGKATLYESTYDITIHCDSKKEQHEVMERLNSMNWIPVSERLPEEDDYKPFSYYEDGAILFCTKNGNVGFGWYYESTKEWANEDDHTPGEVIAWMPLPEPYKEGEQK